MGSQRNLLLPAAPAFTFACALACAIALTLALVLGGCAARGPRTAAGIPVLPPVVDSCLVIGGEPETRGRIVIAFADTVDRAHAPVPRNDAERLVFRHLYETLVSLDCTGRPRPELAESWSAADSGRVWTFTLRAGARFWDGTAASATRVKASWIESERNAPSLDPWPWKDLGAGTDSVRALDERRLEVRLAAPLGGLPAFFGHPALAVAMRHEDESQSWPLGTGGFRPLDRGSEILCVPAALDSTAAATAPAPASEIEFRIRPGHDPRDLHAEGADVLLTRDRSLLSYFAEASGFDTAPLAWDRVYLIVAPAGIASPLLPADPGWLDAPADEIVAADAIRASALAPCPAAGASAALRSPTLERPPHTRIVYSRDDPDAGRIAERIAALGARWLESLGASATAGAPPVAAGLDPAAYDATLATGADDAYILRLERSAAASCFDPTPLLARAPWLDPEAFTRQAMPLVMTRPHLITRQGLAAVSLDHDGVPRFDGAGWRQRKPEP